MRLVLTVALLTLSAPQLTRAQAAAAPPQALRTLVEEYWQWRLKEFPEQATWLGDHRYDNRLADLSPAAIERRKGEVRRMLARARAIDAARLTGQNALTHALFVWELDLAVAGHRFPSEVMILDQLDGPQLSFAQLSSVTPFRTVADYDAYLARLGAYPRYIEQVTALLRRGIEIGWVQPNGPLRGIPEQLEGLIRPEPSANPLFAPFTKMPATIPAGEQARLRATAQVALSAAVIPALTAFREFVQGTYLPAGNRAISISTVKDGPAFYAYMIRQHTTAPLLPEAVHRTGLAEVARIREQMDSVVRQVGFAGTFKEFLTSLRTDRRFYFSNPDELVTAYRDVSMRADAQLPRQFAVLPRNTYGVRPFPDFEAPSQTTARYYQGAQDGSRAGYFMVNTYRLDMRPKYEIEALTLHEAVPGHHLQISRAQELSDLPSFRRNAGYTAFVEGWGLYAESLGSAMGFYGDPYSKFGQLTYEMWRACRLVVDTGIHHLGWSRQQAIDFMTANTAKSDQDIAVEVDRYIVWPGQALAYKMGELKIKELRALAERELGPRFDVRKFHNAVLDNGPLPLDVLDREVGRWIRAQKALK